MLSTVVWVFGSLPTGDNAEETRSVPPLENEIILILGDKQISMVFVSLFWSVCDPLLKILDVMVVS